MTMPGEPTVPAAPAGPRPPDHGPLLLLGGSSLAGLAVGALLGLTVGGGGGSHITATTTASSSTSTTSTSTTTTSSTTTTTAPAAPAIVALTALNPTCAANGTVLLTWSTQNAVSVTISDNGAPVPGTFDPSASRSLPLRCPPTSHAYTLVATGSAGRTASRTVRVTAVAPPSTSTSSTTTTT
jgi:hypothetical protein